METDRIERIEQLFRRRYRLKKTVNLFISIIIVILGVTSFVYIWNNDGDGIMTFRWMTVDGTLFTTAIALYYVIVSTLEMVFYTEVTNRGVYYMRLASAVAEGLIMVVVLLSQLPFALQHMHVFRYDMFNMHLLIPVLTILSFMINDSPIGRLTFRQKLHGLWFVTLYAVVMLTLVTAGVIPTGRIPYYFMDIVHMPVLASIGWFLLIYLISYLLSYLLSEGNRRLTWAWFKNVASR